jgi:S1-C subfamily serine protease
LGADAEITGVLVAARATEAAAEYGILPGDLIVAVNRTRVTRLEALQQIVARLPARAPCALQVLRQGQFLYLAFEIEE